MNSVFKAAFEKTAITKMVKMFRAGKIGLPSVAKASKKLQLKPRQLKHLGGGVEGQAHLVTHPKAGLAVQKTYNIGSPTFNPKMIKAKNKMMTKNPEVFAKHLGSKKGKPVDYYEYVPGTGEKIQQSKTLGKDFAGLVDKANKKNVRFQMGGGNTNQEITREMARDLPGGSKITAPSKLKNITSAGLTKLKSKVKKPQVAGDIHMGNVGYDSAGNLKVVDFMPTKSMEQIALREAVSPTSKAVRRALKKGKGLSQAELDYLKEQGVSMKQLKKIYREQPELLKQDALGKTMQELQKRQPIKPGSATLFNPAGEIDPKRINEIMRKANKGGFSKQFKSTPAPKPTEGFSSPVFRG
jgi:hypothetical protein